MILCVLVLLVLMCGRLSYGTAYWSVQDGSINDAATWGGIAPANMDPASDALIIATDNTVTIDGTTNMRVIYDGYYSANWSESQGFAIMNDPNAVLNVNFLFVANAGPSNGRFTQNAGTVNVFYGASDGGIFMIKAAEGTNYYSELPGKTSWGEYILNSGSLNVSSQSYVGDKGKATFIQTGGTFTTPFLAIGDSNSSALGDSSDVAYYNMTGGVLHVDSSIQIGRKDYARGVFNLGDADSTGTIEGNGSLYIRMGNRDWSTAHEDCIFQGWGQVNMTGNLMNAGKVIADSRSNSEVQADRDLDMSSFYYTSCEYYDRIQNAGWFAVNRGRLLLPAVPVDSGSHTLKWGDDPNIPYPALVNSVVMNFNNVNGGTITASLLARDRSDVGLADRKIIGVWNFTNSSIDFGTGSVTLSFRYDTDMAAKMGIDEANLKLFSLSNGTLQQLPFTINTSTHFITLSNVSSLGTYAIGVNEIYHPVDMVIPGGTAPVVDGDLSDWPNANWIDMYQIWGMSNVDGYTVDPADYDLTSAKIAMRWSPTTNKIYLAVMAVDTQHFFTAPVSIDPVTGAAIVWPNWNEVDQIEVYVDAGNHDNTAYCYTSGMYQQAQQYVGGRDNTGGEFMALGGSGGIMNVNKNGIVSAFKTKVNGDVISYEMEITPYDFLNIQYNGTAYDLSGIQDSTVVTLQEGTVIGMDVCVSSHFNADGNSCFCQRYWWDGSNEWLDASAFANYTLGAVTIVQMPGDANGDGMVDVGDLGILAANYGGSGNWAQGDFNGDGLIDVGDLGILAANYGTGSSRASDFDADYAKIFGTAAEEDDDTASTLCSGLGLSLVAGLALMVFMIVKLEE
jgi:hypothetical protein